MMANVFKPWRLLTCLLYLSHLSVFLVATSSAAKSIYQAPSVRYDVIGINAGKAYDSVLANLANTERRLGMLNDTKVHQWVQASQTQILTTLKPYGYFHATVSSKIKPARHGWQAVFTITPGKRLFWRQVEVRITGPGQQDSAFTTYLQHLPIKSQHPFNSKRYEKTKQQLLAIANRRGYLTASFTEHALAIHLDDYYATAVLHFETGPRFYFGTVDFEKTPYQSRFLHRFITFEPGQFYNSEELLALQRNLSNSNYFQGVSVLPDLEMANKEHVPVHVKLQPLSAQQYLFGLGYGTDTKARGTLGWTWRRASDMGNQVQALAKLSQVESNVITRYIIPGQNPAYNRYIVSAGLLNYLYDAGTSRIKNVSLSYQSTPKRWQKTYSLTYQQERYSIGDSAPTNTQLLLPGINWTLVDTEDPIYTRYGTSLAVTLTGGTHATYSPTNFAQAELQAKWIRPLGKKTRSIVRTDLGAIVTPTNQFQKIPLSQRFITGGSQTIRGYNYMSLGPGKYLADGSIELQQQITRKWLAAAFIDGGNAFADTHDRHFYKAAGVGIVYVAPVGPIEITLARPIGDLDDSWKFQLTMGPDL